MNQAHPSAGFAVGNLQTLADRPGSDIRDELIAFYERYYSANLMALAVVGREPLDVLEQWVRARFSQVRNTNASRLDIKVPLYSPGTLPARLDVTPERENFSIAFTFPIASQREHWRAKPAKFDFYSIKGLAEALLHDLGNQPTGIRRCTRSHFHPGQAAELLVGEQADCAFGNLHPRLEREWELRREV